MANAAASVGADPRKRNLAILGAVTAFFLILAVLAVIQQARSLAPKFDSRPFFPGLAEQNQRSGRRSRSHRKAARSICSFSKANGSWSRRIPSLPM